ncbi:MAG TPA: TIGR04295 family B12-binding domain-containing radical SAM protein [Polyangiaceae bacterium]|nr:TIGR04295 family B12-binding domain-containing radical SAM protein [Polyangiaceae bacterium]
MRVALVNPPWSFEGSIYFGCREPHLPLEYGYARALLEAAGHEAAIVDAQLEALDEHGVRERLEAFAPELTVITTAPSYLFWRCAPPELRVPRKLADAVRGVAGAIVVVGPHASTTPVATLRKLTADAVVMGECEEVLARLASTPRERWGELESIAYDDGGRVRVLGGKAACDVARLPPLRWSDDVVGRHSHHHHRFDRAAERPGAEVEASRGCPYACTFCAKNDFRNAFRRRPVSIVLDEVDALVAQGVEYVYFIDEIFLPSRELLEGLRRRPVVFGVQLRIDNWTREMLDLLGEAGCVSIEAGVESITPQGRSLLAKKCRLSTDELTALLVHAKRRVPFVQANLIASDADDPSDVARWRASLADRGVWANEPVPMFPYPGSPDYVLRWGAPDDAAWERAHAHYLERFRAFSDIQDARPLPLSELEGTDAR